MIAIYCFPTNTWSRKGSRSCNQRQHLCSFKSVFTNYIRLGAIHKRYLLRGGVRGWCILYFIFYVFRNVFLLATPYFGSVMIDGFKWLPLSHSCGILTWFYKRCFSWNQIISDSFQKLPKKQELCQRLDKRTVFSLRNWYGPIEVT